MSKDHFAGIWIYDKQKVFISHNRFTNLCKIKFKDNIEMPGYIKNNRIFIPFSSNYCKKKYNISFCKEQDK